MIIEEIFLKKLEEFEPDFKSDFGIDHTSPLFSYYKERVILPAIEAARDATFEILQNETDRIDGEILVVLDEIEEQNKEYRGY